MGPTADGGLDLLRGAAWLAVGVAVLGVAGVAFAGAHTDPMRAAFWLWVAVVGLGLSVFAPARYWWPMVSQQRE